MIILKTCPEHRTRCMDCTCNLCNIVCYKCDKENCSPIDVKLPAKVLTGDAKRIHDHIESLTKKKTGKRYG